VEPAPGTARPSPEVLAQTLRALPARTSSLLSNRLLQGRSEEVCAAFYGISAEAFGVHLLRSALELAEVLGQRVRAPEGAAEEEAWARGLAAALQGEGARVGATLEPVVELCRRLREAGPEVVAQLEQAEQEEARSPRRQKEEWLRRLAVLLLVALTAWLYWTRPPEEPQRPPPLAPGSR
jgi:hypothetical protein